MTDQAKTAPERIHLKFGRTVALGPTIRMWQASQFEGGIEYVRADLTLPTDKATAAMEAAGDWIEAAERNGFDLGAASQMPWAKDVVAMIDDALRALPLTEKDEADD